MGEGRLSANLAGFDALAVAGIYITVRVEPADRLSSPPSVTARNFRRASI